jgi:hypothetical protein
MKDLLRQTIDKLELRHLYALLVGAIVFLVGWWLTFRYSLGRPHGRWEKGHHQRGYGLALIVVSIVFGKLVVSDAQRNHKDDQH